MATTKKIHAASAKKPAGRIRAKSPAAKGSASGSTGKLVKVGVRALRQDLPKYLLEAKQTVAITRHGETIGYFIPSRNTPSQGDLASLKVAAAKLDALLAEEGVDRNALMEEFDRLRAAKYA